jgi:hypothetical protein
LPLFTFTVLIRRPYPYSLAQTPKLLHQWYGNSPTWFHKMPYGFNFIIVCFVFSRHHTLYSIRWNLWVMVQLLGIFPYFSLPLNTVVEMHWLWLIRCCCTFPFNKNAHDFYWIILTCNNSHFNNTSQLETSCQHT